MKILLTGFDPFGGESINPAWEAVKLVKAPEGAEIIKLEVPTVFGKSAEKVFAAIKEHMPDHVMLIGQAGGRKAITPERVAINVMDASIPDNAGYQPSDEAISQSGENAYFSTLPIKKMAAQMKNAGIAAQISNTAGTFVCNYLMYSVLDKIKKNYPDMRAGFIHVPFIPQQVEKRPDVPSMELWDIVKGLEIAIGCLLGE
ncbi:MAG: pyroglutamyl-peptidase I [Clostridia bacterium]|nr:pyroglutamyl-peptidase I [Clostridia bacterium]